MTNVIDIRHLSIAFESDADGHFHEPVVNDVSFSIPQGQCVALVGESGSGKSMTARALMGLLPQGGRVVNGEILFDNRDLTQISEKQWQRLRGLRVGLIFQDPLAALNPLHRVGDQVAEVLRAHADETGLSESEIRAKTRELFEMTKIEEPEKRMRAYPHELSGGQRQRVVIAMAMANRPDLLIADEPTTALDAHVQESIIQLLLELTHQNSTSLLLISHDLAMVKKAADMMHVMRDGKIVETLAPSDSPQHPYTKLLLNANLDGWAQDEKDETFVRALQAGTLSSLVSTHDLSVTYSRRGSGWFSRTETFHALAPMDLSLCEGECLGVIGESGSGKSTLAMAILRLIASEGTIVFMGQRIDGLTHKALREVRQQLQVVFQDPFASLNPRLSCREIVLEGLVVQAPHLTEQEKEAKLLSVMLEVGLDETFLERFPHELSGGERQRLAIARALILEPKVLVLDEPTTALDRALQFQVLDLLKRLQAKRGMTMLYISHDLALVKVFTHRVMVLDHGRCVESGLTKDLFKNPQTPYLKRLLETTFSNGKGLD